MAQMCFLLPNQQRQTLKKTESNDPNQWPGLILSSSTTGLMRGEGTLLPMCRHSDTSNKLGMRPVLMN